MQEEVTAPAEQEAIAPEAPQEAAETAREAMERAFGEVEASEPAEQQEAPDTSAEDGPARGPDGKFVAKDAKGDEGGEAENTGEVDEKNTAEAEGTEPAEVKTDDAPPARFSAAAKAEWAKAPASVRAEALRAVSEMEAGIQQKTETLSKFEPFIKMAGSAEATVAAMSRYVNTENTLRQNPVAGFTEIARNMGLSPQQVGEMLLGQEPGQADPRDQEIARLNKTVQAMQSQLGQFGQSIEQQQQAALQSQITEFEAKNPRFNELANDMATLIEIKKASNLQEAYDMAARINPAPVVETPPPPAPPAQTRPARSPVGAPTSGSNPHARPPSNSLREAITNAFAD